MVLVVASRIVVSHLEGPELALFLHLGHPRLVLLELGPERRQLLSSRLAHLVIRMATGKARQGKARQGKARQGKAI